jgi:hypothetical protein
MAEVSAHQNHDIILMWRQLLVRARHLQKSVDHLFHIVAWDIWVILR